MFQLYEAPGQDRLFGGKHPCFFGMKLDQFSCGTGCLNKTFKCSPKINKFCQKPCQPNPKKKQDQTSKKPSSSRPRFRSLPAPRWVRSGVMSSMRSPQGWPSGEPSMGRKSWKSQKGPPFRLMGVNPKI